MGLLSETMTDETGSGSNKRLVCLLSLLAIIGAFFYSLIAPEHPEPSTLIVEVLAGIVVSALGLTSFDKTTLPKGLPQPPQTPPPPAPGATS